jgi:hypothetical protein
MRAVDVFVRGDCIRDLADPEMRRERLLEQDAVDGWVVIEPLQLPAYLCRAR